MRLEDLTVALRPRTPWEAVDLGCALVRRDYGRILLLWLVSTVPLWGLLALLLWRHPGWFGLAAWWLKPLYDRLPLYHLSRVTFGARPTLKETLREWPRLWSRFLFSALFLRRLSFIRSFALPVWMLEGQKGSAVSARLNALATDGGGSGGSLTWVFVKLEIAVYLGLTLLLGSFGQSDTPADLWDWFADPEGTLAAHEGFVWFSNAMYLLAISLLEPFYVGAGFGLYLNSRIRLEGWDVELAFRKLAARLRPVAAALFTAATALWLLLAGAVPSAHAQEPRAAADSVLVAEAEPVRQAKAEIRGKLDAILADPEFEEHQRKQKIWVPEKTEKSSSGFSWGGQGMAAVWNIVVVIFVAVIVALLVWLVVWMVRNSHAWKPHRTNRLKKLPPAGPRVVMGMDIASDSLPDDILAAARSAWVAGHLREALSLLYRGTLSRLVEQRHLPIRDSDTEDDCLEKVAALGDGAVTDFFRRLTLLWVRAAYAGREAGKAEFEDLCGRWPFAPGSGKATGGGRKVFARATALALCLTPWLCGCKGEWKEIDVELGYQGQARIDPFLAARRLLAEEEISAERGLNWNNLPESYGSTVFASGEGGMSEGRASSVLLWVSRGGHLIYSLGGCGPYNDWNPVALLSAGPASDESTDPILRQMGVKVLAFPDNDKDTAGKSETGTPDTPGKAVPPAETKNQAAETKDGTEDPKAKPPEAGKAGAEEKNAEPAADDEEEDEEEEFKMPLSPPVQVVWGGAGYRAEFPKLRGLKYDRALTPREVAARDGELAHLLSLEHGLGRITLISHARPFRNRYLDEQDHAALLVALMNGAEEAQFIVGLQDSFWSLLWQRGWQPLVGLGVVLVLWLWLNMPRFGPMRQVNLHQTRRFMEHVKSLGFFFYRLKRPDVVLGAAADAVRARAWRRHPYLAGLEDAALVELLAERSDLPPERIRAALQTDGRPASHDLVRRMQDLQTLRLSLE